MKKRGKRKKRKRKKKKSNVRVVDRISALPDEILHNIFSFLDMKTVISTSILSKRWKYLWTSTPYLSFYYHQLCFSSENDDGNSCDHTRFKHIVDNVFLRRENSTIIHKFKVYFCGSSFNSCFLNTWLMKCLESHVQIIDLDVCQYDHFEPEPLELPDNLFTCEVKTLNLDGLFVIPNTMGYAANITSLHLMGVILPDGNRNGELILSLPVVEDLNITLCDYNHLNCLTIICSLLKRFEMFGASCEPIGSRILKIHCPNLTWIKLTICLGSVFKVCSLENLSALSNADITVPKEDKIHAQHLMEIIKGISNVNALTLSPSLVKTITDSPEIMEMLPNLLHNARDFILNEWEVGYYFIGACAIPDILKKLPCVEAFVWKRSSLPYGSTEEVQHWEEQLSVTQSKICHLKTVEIQSFCGTEEELKVLELILKTAICLKEVMIVTKEFTEEQLAELEQKLSALPHASSTVSIRTLRNLHL